jgi:hypothetical protein
MHIHNMGVDFLLAVKNPTSNLDSILILLKVRNLQIKGFDWLLEINFTYQNATLQLWNYQNFPKVRGGKKKSLQAAFTPPRALHSKSFTFQLSPRKKTQHNITSMVNKLSIIQSSLNIKLRDGGEPSPWVNQYSCWYCGKNHKIHLNYF